MIFLFLLCSSYCKLEFLLVPIPSPRLPSSSTYQTYHITSTPPFNYFLYLLPFHCFKPNFLICISYSLLTVLFSFCSLALLYPLHSAHGRQPQCPLLLISFFLYHMLPRSTPLSHALYGKKTICKKTSPAKGNSSLKNRYRKNGLF